MALHEKLKTEKSCPFWFGSLATLGCYNFWKAENLRCNLLLAFSDDSSSYLWRSGVSQLEDPTHPLDSLSKWLDSSRLLLPLKLFKHPKTDWTSTDPRWPQWCQMKLMSLNDLPLAVLLDGSECRSFSTWTNHFGETTFGHCYSFQNSIPSVSVHGGKSLDRAPHNCKNWLGQKFGDLSHSNRKMSKFPFSNWENGTTFFLFVGWCKVSFPSSKPPKNPHHSTCRGPAHWPFRWSLDFIRWKDDWLSRCGWITIHVFQSWRLYRLGASWRFEF